MPEAQAGVVAPEVPVVPAADAAPAPESPADQESEVPSGDEQPSKPAKTYTEDELQKALQKRLGIESRRLERIARAEARAEHAERQLQERNQPQRQAQPSGEPQEKDFKDYEAFLIAKAKHEFREEQKQAERETHAQTEHRQALQRAERMREKITAAAEEFPDIEEIVNGNVPFTQPMVAFFEDSKHAGKLMHHLGTNVKEAARIADLSPAAQFRELVALESKLAAPAKPTNTPAPIVPNRGNSSGAKSIGDLIGGSQEDFEKHRAARLKRK